MASLPLLTRRHMLMLPVVAAWPRQRAIAQATPDAGVPRTHAWYIGVDEVPPSAVAILSRLTLAPGDEVARIDLPGHTHLLAVSGSVEIDWDSVHMITNGMSVLPWRLVLDTGNAAGFAPGSSLTAVHALDSGADVLLLEIVPADNAATPAIAATPVPDSALRHIASGNVAFAAQRGMIFLEQIVEAAGSSAVSGTWRGVEIGEIAAGSATILATRGSVSVTSVDGANERAAGKGERIDAAAGDRYVCADGSLVWRAGAEEPLVVRRAQVVPSLVPG